MRRQVVLAVLICCVTLVQEPAYGARNQNGGNGSTKLTKTAQGVRGRSARGVAMKFPRVTGCTTKTDNGKKIRSCPSIRGGEWFEVADISLEEVEEGEARPEPIKVETHGSWFSQRTGYVWIDAADFELDAPVMNGSRRVGTAVLRLRSAAFDPGFGSEIVQCSLQEILTPYDKSKAHIDQGSCPFLYEVSSAKVSGGKYTARVQFTWDLLSFVFNSGNPAGDVQIERINREGGIPSVSQELSIEVKEIQSVVTCKSNDENGCG
jgi:hypothetical protein